MLVINNPQATISEIFFDTFFAITNMFQKHIVIETKVVVKSQGSREQLK